MMMSLVSQVFIVFKLQYSCSVVTYGTNLQ